MLKITGGKSLDARGFYNNTNIANKMVVKINNDNNTKQIFTIDNNRILGTVLDNKIRIGIDSDGGLIVAKNGNEHIDETILNIEYYFDPTSGSNITEGKSIKLGSFDLTISNNTQANDIPVTSGTPGEIVVEIDRRFMNGKYNWLLPNGKAANELQYAYNSTTDFSTLFNYKTKFVGNDDTIVDILGVDNKEEVENYNYNNYTLFLKPSYEEGDRWINEFAVLNTGTLSSLADKAIVSKYNDNENDKTNTFYILGRNQSGEEKIYKGVIREEIVDTSAINKKQYTGQGSLSKELETGKTYVFDTTITGETINSDDSGAEPMKLINVQGDPVNAKGAISTKRNERIANKIKATYDVIDNERPIVKESYGKIDNNNLVTKQYSHQVGIDSEGRLIISKSNSNETREVRKITVEYYYDSDTGSEQVNSNTGVLLGSFVINMKERNFEILGDSVLEFRDMVYRPNKPTETREKEFTVVNNTDKNISFEVKDKSIELVSTAQDSQEKIVLSPIEIVRQNNQKGKETFTLRATANLNADIPTDEEFIGEIEVTVNITNP